MTSERGLLVSQRGRRGVILTPDGGFRTIWLAGGRREIGEEVPVSSWTPRSRWAGLAAAVMVAIGGSWLGVQQSLAAPVAWVSVDINPSLRLAVDNQGTVRAAVALDSDGQRVLKDLSFERRPLEQVVVSVTALAQQDGFLPIGKPAAVFLTVTPLHRWSPQVGEAIYASDRGVRELARRQRLQLTVQELKLSQREMGAAAEQNLTPARYILRKSLLRQGQKWSAQRVRQESLYDLLKAVHQARATARAQGEAAGRATAAVTALAHGRGPAVGYRPGPSVKPLHPGRGSGHGKKETAKPGLDIGPVSVYGQVPGDVHSEVYGGAYRGNHDGGSGSDGLESVGDGGKPAEDKPDRSGDAAPGQRHDGGRLLKGWLQRVVGGR